MKRHDRWICKSDKGDVEMIAVAAAATVVALFGVLYLVLKKFG